MLSRFVSLILLIIISPLLILVCLLIIIDDGYPILFRQKRIGRNKIKFTIYKFRTMKKSIPDIPTDLLPRNKDLFTKTGPFLRKLSIDELPQLVNIIIGDMRFIGPRPALYNQNKLIKLREEENIFDLYPGVTGWAQVNGRDSLNDAAKVGFEKYYLENKSFFLNFKIILLTIYKVCLAKNIY